MDQLPDRSSLPLLRCWWNFSLPTQQQTGGPRWHPCCTLYIVRREWQASRVVGVHATLSARKRGEDFEHRVFRDLLLPPLLLLIARLTLLLWVLSAEHGAKKLLLGANLGKIGGWRHGGRSGKLRGGRWRNRRRIVPHCSLVRPPSGTPGQFCCDYSFQVLDRSIS